MRDLIVSENITLDGVIDATGIPRLTLVENRPFRSGVVLLRYRATNT
jgi:hypothetical protein